ncbi:MAG: hypothetical protein QGI13_16480 [Rhodospirillales bacterium]|jgi:hypothetical protein|nr:hypothetical protein [Rhodospirillales bacterium]
MSKQGAVYVVWGKVDKTILDRSIASLKAHHPDLPVHIEHLPDEATLLDKARLLDFTPFEETLFLDMDTVVMGNLDFGFRKGREVGLALCICECPWARRYGGLAGDVVEYNTGVMFFTKKARPVFEAWTDLVGHLDSSIVFQAGGDYVKMPLNDQAGFAKAIDDTGFVPYVLPLNWNFRPRWHKSWFGPLKVWHDYAPVPDALAQNNARQADPNAIIGFAVLRDE